jgi:hypothetical protein
MLTEMSLASEQKIEPTKETIASSNSIQELPQELALEPIIQPIALETIEETTKNPVAQESPTFEPNNNLEVSEISKVNLEATINEVNEVNEINEVNEVNEVNRVDTGDLETEEIESPTEKIAPLEEFVEDTNATKPLFAINNIETDELSAAQTDLLVEPSPVTAEINETENENFEEMEHISKNNVEN